MEGANEAARRAVNELLNDFESKQKVKLARCSIFEFDEPPVFAPLRTVEKYLFEHKLAGPSTFFGDALDYLANVRRGVLNRVKPARLLSKMSERLRKGFFLGI